MSQPNPTLDHLQVFLTVAETGSFSAASRVFNRAQPVISYSIANLEEQLDILLFERAGTRQPKLTEAGHAMLEDARRILTNPDARPGEKPEGRAGRRAYRCHQRAGAVGGGSGRTARFWRAVSLGAAPS